LGICLSNQPVSNDDLPNLFYLVGLALRTPGLQVQYLFNPIPDEDMVASSNPFIETQGAKQSAQTRKRDIRIGVTPQDRLKDSLLSRHTGGKSNTGASMGCICPLVVAQK
jgi:hypothetical protein